MVKYGGGISAVRALPEGQEAKRPVGHHSARALRHRPAYERFNSQIGSGGLRRPRARFVSSFHRRSQSSLARRAKGRSDRRRRAGGFERRGGIPEKTERSRRRADWHHRRLPNRAATGARWRQNEVTSRARWCFTALSAAGVAGQRAPPDADRRVDRAGELSGAPGLRRSRPHHLPRRCPAVSQLLGKSRRRIIIFAFIPAHRTAG